MADKYIITVDDNRGIGRVYESETCDDFREAYIMANRLRRKYEDYGLYSHVSIELNNTIN